MHMHDMHMHMTCTCTCTCACTCTDTLLPTYDPSTLLKLMSTTNVLTADAQRHARALELPRSDGAVTVQVPRAEELQQSCRVRGERREQLRYVVVWSVVIW